MKNSDRSILTILFFCCILFVSNLYSAAEPLSSFQAESADIATHLSGKSVLWYQLPDQAGALLKKIQIRNGITYAEALAEIPEAEAICNVSVSSGGAIYIAWLEQQQLVVANYRLNGQKYWEDRINIDAESFKNCRMSAGLGDLLLIETDHFIYEKPRNAKKGSLKYVNQFPNRSSLPYITATGGHAYINRSASDSFDYSLCIHAPELSQPIIRKTFCTDNQKSDEALSAPLPMFITTEGWFSAYNVLLTGAHNSRAYAVSYFLTPNEGWTLQTDFNHYNRTEQQTILGDEVQTHSDKPSQYQPLARRLSVLKNSPLAISAISIRSDRKSASGESLEQIHSYNASLSHLPARFRSALISDVPAQGKNLDQNLKSTLIFTTTTGEVAHFETYPGGRLVKRDSVQLADWNMNASFTTSIVAGDDFSDLLVLAGDGQTWKLSSLSLAELGIETNQASLRTSLATNDMSHGIEVNLEGLIEIDNPGRWALVAIHPYSPNAVTSLINEPSDDTSGCYSLDDGNVNDPDAIGVSPMPGSTVIAATNAELIGCLELKGTQDQKWYLMHYSNEDKEWQFTGHEVTFYFSAFELEQYNLPFYWLPEDRTIVNTRFSSPVFSDLRLDSFTQRDVDVVGWPHIVINADNFSESTNPLNFTALPTSAPTEETSDTGTVVAVVLGTAITVGVIVGVYILYKYNKNKHRGYERI